MCCLFGILDHHASLSVQQRTKLLSVLATQSEVRGRDATGIAYNSGGQLRIFKRAKAAHELRFHLPHDAVCLMGHTRMATQGDEKMNYNNHPFPGTAGGSSFALAHNGVIHNDHTLRSEQGLPSTVVETDSYIAVQLLEREGAVDCSSLARVAELLQGTVALSVLDGENNCYLVKGNNPLCVYHWRKAGLFVYASTEQILLETFRIFTVPFGQPETVKLDDGEILKIDPIGRYSKASFDTKNLSVPSHTYHNWPPYARFSICGSGSETHDPYVSALKSVAHWFGFSGDDVEMMLADGFSLEEIEEMFYDGYY